MTNVEEIFLDAYHCSLLKEDYEKLNNTVCSLPGKELRKVLSLADKHMIYPMVFEALYNSTPSLMEHLFMRRNIEKAEKLTCAQARRTAEFLKLTVFLKKHGLSPIVLKGVICRDLYQEPEQRSSTDEDLLVSEDQLEQYHRAFLEYGLEPVHPETDKLQDHEIPYANGNIYIELHKTPFPPDSAAYGELNRYFVDVYDRTITIDIYGVPFTTMEPTDHLFYQICHAYKHFLNCGIGIRLVSDMVLFSIHHEHDIDWGKVREKCREINAYDFISAVFRIGERYLFKGHFPDELKEIWATENIDEKPLLGDILAGGIYGSSSVERLHSANITLGLAEAGKSDSGFSAFKRTIFPPVSVLQGRYPYLRSKPYLIPVAWVRRLSSYLFDNLFHKRNAGGIAEAVRIGKERTEIMQGYGMLGENNRPGLIKRLYKRSHTSALAPLFSAVFMAICSLEFMALNVKWFLQGDRRPSGEEIELVRENITFIAKSFERQHMVKGLCRNISRLYPGVRIIVSDDSRKPLDISMDNVTVINLPFNTGLGAGLQTALDQVETPYVVRLDDDELLTIRSKVHRELQYLKQHKELDLIGFGHTTAIRLHSPQTNFKEYFKTPMEDAPHRLKVPHLTKLDDTHIVLGKVANIYLARTNKLREVGFDPKIKVIDHHEFFWRAAGVLTSAAALDTVVFHRHDPYNRSYNIYRSDYKADLEYIERKRSRMLRERNNEKKTD